MPCSSGLSEEHPCSFLSLLPSLALTFCFVWGGLPSFFLQWELFHRAGSCLCITEAKEALKGAHPRLECFENWLDVWCVLAVAPFLSPLPQLLPAAQTESQRTAFRSLVLCRNLLLFVLGLIKISHYLYLLSQYLMQNHFLMRTVLGKSATEVLRCQR